MAKCKLCKINIPEGNKYCKDCLDKGEQKANESYLDSLLNSVKNTAPTAKDLYKKKSNKEDNTENNSYNNINTNDKNTTSNTSNKANTIAMEVASSINDTANEETEEIDIFKIDTNDLEDFSQYNLEDDLADMDTEIIINDADLFGTDFSDIISQQNEKMNSLDTLDFDYTEFQKQVKESELSSEEANNNDQSNIDNDQLITETNDTEQLNTEDIYSEQTDIKNNDYNSAQDRFELEHNIEDNQEYNNEDNQEVNQKDDYTVNNDQLNQQGTASEPLDIPAEFLQFEDENDIDQELNALLSNLDGTNYQSEQPMVSDEFDNQFELQKESSELSFKEETMFGSEDDDIMSLLNQISSDDPVSEDIQAISDLLNGSFETNKSPSDVGEVFSDALKVVSSLTDLDYDEEAILNSIPEKSDMKDKKGKKSKKAKVNKKNNEGSEDKTDENKSKEGFFKRLFGNILDEDEESENKSTYDGQDEVAATKQQTKKSKKKAAKGKKGSSPTEDEDEDSLDNKGKIKADKKQAKKDKKDKKKKDKEIIQVIDEIEEDEGRINRLGASIVFVFFGLLTVLLLVGTNVVSYSLSIQNATDYFEKQKYTQAYKEVNGMKIKDEDIEIYDKIKTVMFVNKQLNSYNSFYSLKKYPEALDSLLKGLKRYDKYIELATILGIKTDLDYVRSQILAELNNVFNLSEKEAMKMLGNDDIGEYSLKVYDVVLEKMNN